MASRSGHRQVEGEPLDLLCEAICQIDGTQGPDGMWSFDARLEPRLANPFVRALMRIESRLLREDAQVFEMPGHEQRRDEQRKADAFVILVTSVAKARMS